MIRVERNLGGCAALTMLFLFGVSMLPRPIRAQQQHPQPQTEQPPPPPPAVSASASSVSPPSPVWKGLQYRGIGPFRGGRVTAVAGIAAQPLVYYFGATGGGVWKTTDGGVNWEPISDAYFKTGSVGAIGISDADLNTIYVGMGESPIRGNVSHGDGMYKSMDAGRTWKRTGLDDTRHISRVRVHPRNPDVVYVAALGHAFGPNEQRGVFRSKDGGKNWEKILYRNEKAGAIDLTFDPTNPNILYAALWEVVRRPWSLESGGPASGLFKSIDGGDTWTEITRNPGLPRGLIGKAGITVSPMNPERVWAIIEAEDGGVFRSDNGGRTWTKTNDERHLRQRAWYYTRIYADSRSADTVYVLNVAFHKSTDGGRTFANLAVPHADNHDLWIAPDDSARMINGNDGGANVSVNGGQTWTEQDQPTAQFYRVTLDQDFPYHVYGAQQDNSTIRIKSRTVAGFGIDETDWHSVGGGESGWIAPHPNKSDIVFAGSYGGLITRYDHRTGQLRNITVWPDNPMGAGAEAMKYRFQWNFPILFSPHDPNTLYAAGNILFRTTNEGQSWAAISPDLTRNDRSKQGPSGGPITKDNTSVEYYSTIFTVMESPVEKGTIWAGSDDGLIHITRSGGKNWENVTPKEMPEWIQINSIEASAHDPASAYVAATMYKWDDFRPYLYKTNDYGKTWRKITGGIPATAFTRVVREDPARRGLLYAGTETGMYVSFDDGEHWHSLQLNLPVVPITDLAVHKRDKDLIVATQGRSFWILDDLTVLHQLADDAAAATTRLFKPEDAYRVGGFGGSLPPGANLGRNPPGGAIIYYYLKETPARDVTLEFFDSENRLIRKYTAAPTAAAAAAAAAPAPSSAAPTPPGTARVQTPPAQPRAPSGEESAAFGTAPETRLPIEAGLNSFVWDLRYDEAARFPGMILWAGETRGPRVVPGTYRVKLTVDGRTMTETFELKKDPRLATTPIDYARQLELLLRMRDKLTETHNAITRLRTARAQINELIDRLGGEPAAKPVVEAGKALNAKLTAVEEELYQTKNRSSQDPLNYPIRLNNKLAALAGVVASADAAPTDQSYALYEELTGRIDAQLQKLNQLMEADLQAFNNLVREQRIPAVIVKSPTAGRR